MPKKSYLTVTDQFCGCGGSSTGAQAAGCEIAVALNHWPLAIATHNSNFQQALHECASMTDIEPSRYAASDFLIASPECTNHALAKGKKRKNLNQLNLLENLLDPSEERSRATMDDVIRFTAYHRYNFVVVENVCDVFFWSEFDRWLKDMQNLGYEHQCVFFNSMFCPDLSVPQSRDRIYIVFSKKGNPKPNLDFRPLAWCVHCDKRVNGLQSWKNPQKRWGKYGRRNQYIYRCPDCKQECYPFYRPAFAAIDWSLPSPRIGDRSRPLKETTLERIRRGLEKFRFEENVIVTLDHTQDKQGKAWGTSDPLPTQTARQNAAIATLPFISTERFEGVSWGLSDPLPTVMAGRVHHRLVEPPGFMTTLRAHSEPKPLSDALDTVLAGGTHHGLTTLPFVTGYYSNGDSNSGVDEAIPTVSTTDRHGLVTPPDPFLVHYYTGRIAVDRLSEPIATVSTQPRTYLVEPSASVDLNEVGFRMLQPHEIHRAMAFPPDYIVLGNKRQQIRQYGNAVTPPVMEMLVRACIETIR